MTDDSHGSMPERPRDPRRPNPEPVSEPSADTPAGPVDPPEGPTPAPPQRPTRARTPPPASGPPSGPSEPADAPAPPPVTPPGEPNPVDPDDATGDQPGLGPPEPLPSLFADEVPVALSPASEVGPAPGEAPVLETVPIETVPINPVPINPVPINPVPEPSSRNLGPIIVGGVIGLLVVVGAIFFFVGGDDGDDVTAQPSTTVEPSTTASTADTTTSTSEASTTTSEASPDSSTTTVGGPLTVAELARSTVQVVLLDAGEPTCSGSGTIVEADGTILTNAHVVESDAECPYDTIGIAVTDDSGTPPQLRFQAEIYGFDRTIDLAVLKVSATIDGASVDQPFAAVAIGDSDEVVIGDQLRILGYPSIGGDTVTFTRGVVSGFTSQTGVGDRSWIKTDATIAGGNSGGAAFDADGRLIGVPTQAAASADGPVVDCRVITDTDGDGLFTENDQCVPIGGFLNGIRPVNLAIPLLQAARDGGPVDIEDTDDPSPPPGFDPTDVFTHNPDWSLLSSDDPGFDGEFVSTATAGIGQLCIWFDWEGMADGVLWDGVWLIDGVVAEAYSFFAEAWELGPEGTDAWVCAIDEAGLVAGVYEFAFLVEEEIEFIESIRLTPEPVEIHRVEFVNLTDNDLCFLFVAPAGASDTGLDELGRADTVAPGDGFVVDVPAGEIIADAYDCDFDPIYEEYDGLVIDADTVIEVGG